MMREMNQKLTIWLKAPQLSPVVQLSVNPKEPIWPPTMPGNLKIPTTRSEVDKMKKDKAVETLASLGELVPPCWTAPEVKSKLKELLFKPQQEKAQDPFKGCGKWSLQACRDMADQWMIQYTVNENKGSLLRKLREEHLKTSTPVGTDYMQFGKHANLTYAEVLANHPGYAVWCKNTVGDESHWLLQRFVGWLSMEEVVQEPDPTLTPEQLQLANQMRGSSSASPVTPQGVPVPGTPENERVGHLENRMAQMMQAMQELHQHVTVMTRPAASNPGAGSENSFAMVYDQQQGGTPPQIN